MGYALRYTAHARKDIRAIKERSIRRRLEVAILRLTDDPLPADAKKLSGTLGIWRIRVGGWRVCYQVRDGELLVLVIIVARRGEVYERLKRWLG